MPIKLPKGFPRRKSSGNVLDETQNAEPSFKVYSRPTSSGQILDVNAAQKRPMPIRKNSYEEEDDDLFTVAQPSAASRGSRTAEKSLSATQYDSGASSSRLSTSSTNPSSVDAKSDKNIQAPKEQAFADIPVPPAHQQRNGGFLRNAGRTFSFGVKSQKGVVEPDLPPAVPAVPAGRHRFSVSNSRERAMTTSSVATTTPPRLLDSDLALDNSELDGFGNMFDGIGARPSRDPSPSRQSPAQNALPYTGRQLHPDNNSANRVVPPKPLYINKSATIESSPYSWNSETSRDGLMRSPSPSKTVTQNSPQTAMPRNMFNSPSDTTSQAELGMEDSMFDNTPSRARAYSRPQRQNGAPPPSYAAGARLTDPPQSPGATIVSTEQVSLGDNDNPIFDPSLLASAEIASKYQAIKPKATEATKKVMTPQQFERYKQQETERQRMNRAFGKTDSDESGDDYEDEDEDETERDRQASKQRRKQEAHLAVYRQTMMKVTGEAASSHGRGSGNYGNNLGPAQSGVTNRLSNLSFGPKSPADTAEEDEDEDVPLGILAAHGFPNRNKPPSKLAASGSNPNLRGLAQSQVGPGSVAGESVNRSSLPAFARKLPEDPYFGAGLVSPSNRESLAFHSTPAMLSPSGAHTNHPHHPAGLVGVIAGEERARAARRGSPNAATGQYDLPPTLPEHPSMMRSHTMGQIPTMPMPGMPLSPGDQAQIQMSQQMTQMMQMQMQWMQQMQQFMANRGPSPTANMPGMPGMPGFDPAIIGPPRPQSVPLQSPNEPAPRSMSLLSPNMANYNGPTNRSMSTLSPSMANWNQAGQPMNGRPGSTYATSIAPSERSNVGLASRYRPVSTVQEPTAQDIAWQKRASTMTSPLSPWSTGLPTKQSVSQNTRPVNASTDDDDDEAGWAEMKAKKDKKQKSWKLRKGNNPLQELYN